MRARRGPPASPPREGDDLSANGRIWLVCLIVFVSSTGSLSRAKTLSRLTAQRANSLPRLAGYVTVAVAVLGVLGAVLLGDRAITLTDDFVPVDQLVARVFVERGF